MRWLFVADRRTDRTAATSILSLALAIGMAVGAGALAGMPSGLAAEVAAGNLTLHGQITHDALAGTLAPASLKAVIDADDSQDTSAEGLQDKRRHFDGSNMPGAVAYVNREKNRAIEMAAEADTDAESRADALRHFGLMLHCMQDFYLRSNYVEMHLADPQNRESPYDMPLADWSKLPSGYTRLAAAQQGHGEDGFNKENPESAAGKTIVSGKVTQFAVARELAVRETQRQWNLFEALVRSRCGSRSAAVLSALRQSGQGESEGAKRSSDASDFR